MSPSGAEAITWYKILDNITNMRTISGIIEELRTKPRLSHILVKFDLFIPTTCN